MTLPKRALKVEVMSLDLPTFAQYLRLLQSEGQTHLTLSKGSLQTLRGLFSQTGRSSSIAPRSAGATAPSEAVPPSRTTISKESAASLPAPQIILKSASGIQGVDLGSLDLESGSRAERIERLEAMAQRCQHCAHLVASRGSVVFGGGNPEAKLMLIGEAPGPEENEIGKVFVGAAGQLLTKMIEAMGMKREEIYLANVLKCRPDMPEGAIGNRKPTVMEMKGCLPFLQAQITIIQPKVIVALGATAMEGLLEEKTPIGKLRGNWLHVQGIPLLPTYHPTYLLRNQSVAEKRKVWEDLLQVMERLELPISDKQRGYFLSKA